MANYYQDNDDLQFYMHQGGIDWKPLIDRLEGDYSAEGAPESAEEAVQTYSEMMGLIGEFSAEQIAPRAADMDRNGAHMKDGKAENSPGLEEIFEQFKEMGMFGLMVPRELGGMQLPNLMYFLMSEVIARGDVSTLTHFGFHVATASTLLEYSIHEGSTEWDEQGRITKTRFQKEIEEIIEGKTWGSMDLTEPNAGSDLAALRAKAEQDEDGVWRITGNKIFITSGNGNYHIVLAKTENKNSLKALSLFLVPLVIEREGETIQNAYVDRIEEKIGHHASPTCSIQYENSEGHLLGEVGEGFKLMLKLMNHARLGVGFESIGLCEAAYREAKAYAEERQSMGKPIAQHPMIADYLDEMDITIRGIRAIGVEAAIAEEHATLIERELASKKARGITPINEQELQKEARKLHWKARKITPLLKYISSESAVAMSRMAMQILGGNGYTKDYAPERLLRDALVLPIYEGTSQIQALMALKDRLGSITRNPQKFLGRLANAKVKALRATDPLERAFFRVLSQSYAAQRHILWKVAKEKFVDATEGPWSDFFDNFLKNWDPKKDFDHGLLHAEHLCKILIDVEIGKALLRQAQSFPERRDIAARWFERVEPRVRYHLDLIQSTGERILKKLESSSAQSETA